jgi:hypothetical protein
MEEIKREIKNLEKNEKENATCQILWNTTKVVERGEFMAITSYATY